MAAKVIRVSDDDGSTWYTLPGSTGEFANEAESISDTTFGQTFESSEIGLLGWMVSANAYFKGYAGYLAKILQPGTPTATTGEACTLVSGKTYQINDTAKRIWDRSATIVVYDNAVDHSADVQDIDYLFGKVTFDSSYTVTGAVTVDVTYLPMTQLGKGQSYNLTMSANPIDNTDFATAQANGGYKTFEPGLRTVALELSGIFDATVNSKADLAARNELIVEIDPAGDQSSLARGFFKIVDTGQSGDVGALEEETLSLELTVPEDPDFTVAAVFGWQHSGSTLLSQAIQILLTAWLDESLIDVQYLPQGAVGQTPLDGAEGDCMVADVSLSGGLNDMNTFNVELQGIGAYTEV